MQRRALLVLAVVAVLGLTVGSAEAAKKKKDNDGMVDGKVKSVDTTAGSLVLEGRKDKKTGAQKPDTIVKIGKDTKVTMAGADKAIADVTTGARVTIKLADDKVTAATIELGGAKKEKKKDK